MGGIRGSLGKRMGGYAQEHLAPVSTDLSNDFFVLLLIDFPLSVSLLFFSFSSFLSFLLPFFLIVTEGHCMVE